jgi:hypothetical protein
VKKIKDENKPPPQKIKFEEKLYSVGKRKKHRAEKGK